MGGQRQLQAGLATGDVTLRLLEGDDGPAQGCHDLPVGDHLSVQPDAGLGLIAAVECLARTDPAGLVDRKSTRLTPVTNAHLVCRLLLETKKQPNYLTQHTYHNMSK